MRSFILLLLAAAGPVFAARPATELERVLLRDAVVGMVRDMGNWAYTETSVQKDDEGKVKRETIVRFDPSKPYAEQYTPIKISGRAPTEKELKKYRTMGERRQKHVEPDAAGEGAPKKLSDNSRKERPSFGELLQLEKALVVKEDDKTLTFEVPLPTQNNKRFPPEKFLVLARVNKIHPGLEAVEITLRESLRAAVVVKVKSGAATIDFMRIDETHPPVMASIRADARVSMMFIPIGGRLEQTRTEWKRVKPYADRFGVQVGDLKALDF